jgi:integrase
MSWVEQRGGQFRVRLRLPDGTVVTDSTHATKPLANIRAKEIDVELARDSFLDPRDGKIPLREWVSIWEKTHRAAPATWSAYRSHLRLHILPRLGHLPLSSIRRQHIKALVMELTTKMSPRSAADVIMVLSMVLREAMLERRIEFNPANGVKVGAGPRPERPHATPMQVTEIINRMSRQVDQVLVVTAAYTGMRWGELTGLDRANLNLDQADIYIHPTVGALHEVDGKLYLGPPKTADSVRHVRLPDFLVQLLHRLLASHPYPTVFPGGRGGFQRRSNFTRRAWTPAVNGDRANGIPTIVAGMHFHDLRHTHKTWLIEDGIPEIAQARRMGHRLPGVRGIYSHVTAVMEHTVADALQHRWAISGPSPLAVPEPHSLDHPDVDAASSSLE